MVVNYPSSISFLHIAFPYWIPPHRACKEAVNTTQSTSRWSAQIEQIRRNEVSQYLSNLLCEYAYRYTDLSSHYNWSSISLTVAQTCVVRPFTTLFLHLSIEPWRKLHTGASYPPPMSSEQTLASMRKNRDNGGIMVSPWTPH